MTDIAAKLAAPFDPAIVSWRVGPTNQDKTKGMALAYLDARDVMRRLDEVCGAENWQDNYPWSDGKRVVCSIGINIERMIARRGTDGLMEPVAEHEWVWKTDGAGDTDMEGEKGALSDAFKRAAVKWGIGRYLYDTDSPWVQIEQRGKSYVIPDAEKAKLANLLRRQFPAAPQQQERNATNGAGAGAAGEPLTADPARKANHDRAVEIRDRVRAQIENAQEPIIIEEALRTNRVDLEFILAFHEPTYRNLLALASTRSTELLASA